MTPPLIFTVLIVPLDAAKYVSSRELAVIVVGETVGLNGLALGDRVGNVLGEAVGA